MLHRAACLGGSLDVHLFDFSERPAWRPSTRPSDFGCAWHEAVVRSGRGGAPNIITGHEEAT